MPISHIDPQDTDARVKMNSLIDAVNAMPVIAGQIVVNTGEDDEKIVTPLKLKTHLDTTRRAGQTVVNAGEDNSAFITPLTLKTHLDTVRVAGQTAVNDGVATDVYVVPATLATLLDTVRKASAGEVTTGTVDTKFVTPLRLQGKIDAVTAAYVAAIATETSNRNAAIAASEVARSAANARPGFNPTAFTNGTYADPTSGTADGSSVQTARGWTRRLTGAGQVATRRRYPVVDGLSWKGTVALERVTNPTDPAGDQVDVFVVWLQSNGTYLGFSRVFPVPNGTPLFVADGRQVLEFTFGGATTDKPAPGGAVDGIISVRTYGSDGVTDLDVVHVEPGAPALLVSQLDDKAPLDSPAFTGTVTGITKAMVGLSNVDNTADANKPVSTAQQAALDAKAPLNNPTFTGTVSGVTKAHVGLGNVDNTADADKPVSTATATALAGKVSTADLPAGVGSAVTGAAAIATPDDADTMPLSDASASNGLRKLTFANLWNWIRGLADARYAQSSSLGSAASQPSSAFAAASHNHVATAISDSTPAGRALLTGADAAAQRSSLGLGTAATTAASAYATSAQGAKADSAIQPGNAALTDAREWTGATVSQPEAEAGDGTTRRAWTAERVRQAISAWWGTGAGDARVTSIAAPLIAVETAARQELAGEFASGARDAPGLNTDLFTETLTGKAADAVPIAVGAPATSDEYGTAWQIAGTDVTGPFIDVAARQDFPLIPGRVYRVRAIVERNVDPVDPLSDGIEVRVQNLTKTHANLSNVRYGDAHTVTVAGGALDVSFTIGRLPPEGVTLDYAPPSTARNFRPVVRIYGGAPAVTNVVLISVTDVTETVGLADRVSGLESITIEGLASSVTVAEYGTSVTPTLTWTLAGTAEVSSLTVNGANLALDAEEWTAPFAISGDQTYTVAVTATNGDADNAAVSVDFRPRVFWGASAAASLDSAGVIGLSGSQLATSRALSKTVTAADQYVYVAYPAEFNSHVDYRLFGFAETPVVTAVSVTTAAGFTGNYFVLRSPNPLTTNVPVEVA